MMETSKSKGNSRPATTVTALPVTLTQPGLPAAPVVGLDQQGQEKQARATAKKARKEARRAERRAAEAQGVATHATGTCTDGAPIIDNNEVNVAASTSVAHRPLPAPPLNLAPDAVTICLMYQYKEPAWTVRQHKGALTKVSALAAQFRITGRGRCAPEGLNCTLTAHANDMRAFCYALRAWDPLFHETDFKLEDDVEASAKFRTFTLRKVHELVGYGLDGVKAPSLTRHAGTHLEAMEYHKQLQQPDTVIVDVRNAYESAIGHFAPPPGGAQLLDPQMRTSSDFPKWLNAPETKKQLHNKTVMMYCTGGIRCERATALLNQLTEVAATTMSDGGDADDDIDGGFQTKGVVMVRGGIERYLKTFPEGGFWKGKNYLFDKRMEQAPSNKTEQALAADVESACCLCQKPHSQYRGQHKCATSLPSGMVCAVPVLVCPACQPSATDNPDSLTCPLCTKGYHTPETAPDLLGQKRKLGVILGGMDLVTGQRLGTTQVKEASRRLFVGKLALSTTASVLRRAFANVNTNATTKTKANNSMTTITTIQWIVDQETRAFYGSAFLQMASLEEAKRVVAILDGNAGGGGIEVVDTNKRVPMRTSQKRRRRLSRVAFAPLRNDEVWPPMGHSETEFPPMGLVIK